jgi:hypothetical protein
MSVNSGVSLSGAFASLARINTRYLIEWHRSGVLYRSIALPLPPSALTIEQGAPSQVIYTLGDDPIREIGRYKSRSIELSGSAGYDFLRTIRKQHQKRAPTLSPKIGESRSTS